MTIRIQLTHSTLKLVHDFQLQTDQARVAEVQTGIQVAIQETMTQAFNPLAAVAMQQHIKQRAEQKLRQEQRIRQQQQQLQTVAHENGMIQTLGTIFAPRYNPSPGT